MKKSGLGWNFSQKNKVPVECSEGGSHFGASYLAREKQPSIWGMQENLCKIFKRFYDDKASLVATCDYMMESNYRNAASVANGKSTDMV